MKRKKKAVILCCGDPANTCTFGCIGCGACEQACRLKAISVPEGGAARVKAEICVGCGLCVKSCPQQIILLIPAENTIQPRCANRASAKEARAQCGVSCIGCGICERACPSGAIHVTGNLAVIDQGKCIACGMCAAKCPRGVIHDANGIITAG